MVFAFLSDSIVLLLVITYYILLLSGGCFVIER